jgi:hypothetical protein
MGKVKFRTWNNDFAFFCKLIQRNEAVEASDSGHAALILIQATSSVPKKRRVQHRQSLKNVIHLFLGTEEVCLNDSMKYERIVVEEEKATQIWEKGQILNLLEKKNRNL